MSPLKVCSYSDIEYKNINDNSEKHMVEMADQSQPESRKRIVNFYLGNKEKGKSFTSTIFKSGVLRKTLFTHFLQSFEDRKTTKKKAGSGTICPKPPAQARKCLVKSPEGGQLQEAWFKTQLHVRGLESK